MHPLCLKRSLCSVTPIGFTCASYLIPGKLKLLAGIARSHTLLVLNDTRGGQILNFQLYLGNATKLQSIAFGPSWSPQAYACTKIQKSAHSVNDMISANCTLGAGFGARLYMSAQTCWLGNCTWVRGNDTFAFTPPYFTDNTIRLTGGSFAVGGDLKPATTSQLRIAFDGKGFSADVNMMQVYFGPANNPRQYPCLQDPATTDSTLVCVTPSGATGQFMSFVIDAPFMTSITSSDTVRKMMRIVDSF